MQGTICAPKKLVCDFLLMFSINLGTILHRFGDELKAENVHANFPIPALSFSTSASNVPFGSSW